MNQRFRPGVASGDEVQEILDHANQNEYALPAVNVVSTNSVNGVLEAAKEVDSPVIVQFSNGGAVFFAGKSHTFFLYSKHSYIDFDGLQFPCPD